MRHTTVIALIAACIGPVPLSAQQAAAEPDAPPHDCEIRDRSEIIAVVYCPNPLAEADLAEVGRAVCGDRLPCGAWFWTDGGEIPDAAPENHDGLTEPEVVSALGVWVAETESMITIAPVTD